MRFVDNTFTMNFFNTIGVDFKMKTIHIDGKTVRLQIWDTAGQERFQTITCNYYNGAHGIIIVYDVTDRESFNSVKRWMAEIKKHTQADVLRLLVANKTDMSDKREVKTEEGLNLASSYGVGFVEASAKDATNVTEAFTRLSKEMLEKTEKASAERTADFSQDSLVRPQVGVQRSFCCSG